MTPSRAAHALSRWLAACGALLPVAGWAEAFTARAAPQAAAAASVSSSPLPAAWRPTVNRMRDGRWAPAAALLPGGASAVIAGGYSYAARSCVASIDVYDEPANRFRPSRARLLYPCDFGQAVPLPGGEVLICGGFNDVWGSLAAAQVYDAGADAVRPTRGRMQHRRELFQATPLIGGDVLLTGGLDLTARGTTASAELYHPASDAFTPTAGDLGQDRFGHAACRLADGRVLIVGGTHWNIARRDSQVLASAELYDPATGRFTPTRSPLLSARDRPTATLLPGGEVLVYGGQGANGAAVTTAELFDPRTERFTLAPLPPQTPRMAHAATPTTRDGRVEVVIAGGWDADAHATTASAVRGAGTPVAIAPLPDLPFASHDAAMIAFADGAVLVAGGKVVTAAGAASSESGGALLESGRSAVPRQAAR